MAYATISKPSLHYNTKLYTGNGSTQSITGLGFQPDLNWIKCRDVSENHNISDSVRGDSGANSGYYYITPNANDMQGSGSGNTYVSSLDADGFSIGNNDVVNTNAQPFISWNWKANGAGSANTDGTINSTVSANTIAGFSIVKWTATGSASTIGHGLGVAPKMIIGKRLDSAGSWLTYHASLDATDFIKLHDTAATEDNDTVWNDTEPTSSVFSVGTGFPAGTFIAYCFADVAGFSKMGSFEGNLNADGPFVYTGFKPTFLLLKNADNSASGDEWFMEDATRSTYNPTGKKLSANISNAETTGSWVDIDFLSNGFKIRTSDQGLNEHTMIYMAFGQTMVGTNDVPATAR